MCYPHSSSCAPNFVDCSRFKLLLKGILLSPFSFTIYEKLEESVGNQTFIAPNNVFKYCLKVKPKLIFLITCLIIYYVNSVCKKSF